MRITVEAPPTVSTGEVAESYSCRIREARSQKWHLKDHHSDPLPQGGSNKRGAVTAIEKPSWICQLDQGQKEDESSQCVIASPAPIVAMTESRPSRQYQSNRIRSSVTETYNGSAHMSSRARSIPSHHEDSRTGTTQTIERLLSRSSQPG